MTALSLLLDRGADLESRTGTQGTPLLWACMGGSPEVLRHLLQRGADISAVTKVGDGPVASARRPTMLRLVSSRLSPETRAVCASSLRPLSRVRAHALWRNPRRLRSLSEADTTATAPAPPLSRSRPGDRPALIGSRSSARSVPC